MDRRERKGDLDETMLAALEGWQAGLWTAMPAIIQSFDPVAMTVTAQPAVQARVQLKDGSWQWVDMPVLVDVPVQFQSGGGYTLTFPIVAGDEALIIFASRCIDSWWQSGGYLNRQAEMRMHDLSDGFALVGIRSQPRVVPGISVSSVQLRTDTGETFVEVEGTTVNINAMTVNVTAPNVNLVAETMVHMTTPALKITGDVTVFEGTPDEFTMSDIRDVFNTHNHSGVQGGGGNSGPPNQDIP